MTGHCVRLEHDRANDPAEARTDVTLGLWENLAGTESVKILSQRRPLKNDES